MNRWMGQHKTEEKTPNRGKSIKVVATISLHLWTLRRICALFVARRDTPMHCLSLNKERERGRLRTCDYETLTNCKCHSWHSFANCFMYNLTLCGHNIVHHKTKMVGGSIWMLRCGAQRCGYDQIHDMTRIFWENSYQTSIFPGMGRCPELLVFQIFTRCLRSSWSNASSLTPCTAIRFPGWLAFVWRPREIDSYGRANEERRRIEIGSEEWDNDRFGTFDTSIFGNSFLQWNWRCHRLIKVKTSKHPGCLGRTQQKQGGSLAEWKGQDKKKTGEEFGEQKRRRVWRWGPRFTRPKKHWTKSVVVTGGGKRGGSGTPPRSTKHFDTESSSCICFCCFDILEPFSSTFMDHAYGMIWKKCTWNLIQCPVLNIFL